MAVTIRQQPQSLTPGFNDIIFVVSSTNVAQTNFQYVCDIYVQNDSGAVTHAGNSYIREKTPADPVYSSGVFNVSNILRSFLTYDIGDDIFGSQKSTNSVIQIQCNFGEEYGASSGVVVYPNTAGWGAPDTATSDIKTIWNGVFDYVDFKDYLVSQYSNSSANTTVKLLTNQPATRIIRSGENAWLYKINTATNEMGFYYCYPYTSAGSLTQPCVIRNNFVTINSTGRYMIRYPSGWNLNSIPAADFITGSQPILTSTVAYYLIFTTNSAYSINSQTYRFNVDTTCTDHTVYRLHFLNKLGGFDSFSFIKAHTFDTDIKRESYKRNTTQRIGGGQYGYNKSTVSQVQFLTTNKDTVKVNSDWIDEDTSTWLEELLTSPVVFLDDATHGLIAVNIVDSKYTRKQWRTDGLSNLELSFQYGYDRYRQTL
ncbi:MAG: hypothetical protein NUV80_03040 [Candidatus Berkelbacteria bacterium]|nr:hypothetical protein [Candidatus Berkelbacteria bacterium]